MDPVQLERFTEKRLLGVGANYEVHAAIDSQTGAPVVLKRPWVQYISRNQHQQVDKLSARVIELHRTLGGSFPHISHLVGYTGHTRHDRYFGDALSQSYYVLVEERARGVPLMGGIKDKFRGVPIGLAQNLYTLYPLVSHAREPTPGIMEQLLDLEAGCIRMGYLLLDLGPQNVFFDPRAGRITVIDIGESLEYRAAQHGNQGADLHDAFAELCRFYLTPHPPPTQVGGYREPFGIAATRGFQTDLERITHSFCELTAGPLQEAAVTILHQVKSRAYGSIDAFRQDLQRYFALVEDRNRALPDWPGLLNVWREGMEMLHETYWRRFLFEPETDLIHYR
jgi:serine/threonine protein kinase